MPDNFDLNETINNVFARLQEFIKTETVVGEPVQVGDVTIIPFVNVSFGVGTGGGTGKDREANQGSGGGAGSGGKISPTAVLVIKGDNAELLSIDKSTSLERLAFMVPDLVDKFINLDAKNKEAKEKKVSEREVKAKEVKVKEVKEKDDKK
jgi:uncharacterized spore protein YtfJ